jgi:hypothetical protein
MRHTDLSDPKKKKFPKKTCQAVSDDKAQSKAKGKKKATALRNEAYSP